MLQPIGIGEPRELRGPGLVGFTDSAWSDDGHVVANEAQSSKNEWNVYFQKVAGGPPLLVKSNGRFACPVPGWFNRGDP